MLRVLQHLWLAAQHGGEGQDFTVHPASHQMESGAATVLVGHCPPAFLAVYMDAAHALPLLSLMPRSTVPGGQL